ncbi:MAG: hypothetical protein LBP74_05215, partial [Treponema sp.]|nr:hypothetical protein [Treponema sp.]
MYSTVTATLPPQSGKILLVILLTNGRSLFKRIFFLFCLLCLSSCTGSDPPAFLVDLVGGKASKPS